MNGELPDTVFYPSQLSLLIPQFTHSVQPEGRGSKEELQVRAGGGTGGRQAAEDDGGRGQGEIEVTSPAVRTAERTTPHAPLRAVPQA